MAKLWMKEAFANEGAFTRKAKAADMGVQAYARQVLKPGSRATTKTKRQAALAKRAGSGDISRMRRARQNGQRRAARRLTA